MGELYTYQPATFTKWVICRKYQVIGFFDGDELQANEICRALNVMEGLKTAANT